MPFPLTQWRTAAPDSDAVAVLCHDHGISVPIASSMVNRGILPGECSNAYLDPRLRSLSDPFLLTDMERAVTRIWKAIDSFSRITIFGDFDVDGVTSVCLLTEVLSALGGLVSTFIPHRLNDGYGMTPSAVQRCLSETHPELIISVDCGVTAVDAVNQINASGVDVVITDHHEPSDVLPDAIAVVNPKRDRVTGTEMLAGVGVVFKLCHALIKRGRGQSHSSSKSIDLRQWLDIVATGTVADVVPLTGENRALVNAGLAKMNRNPSPGLSALISQSGITGTLNAHHLGFMLGPRLNASGRLGSAETALALLMSKSLDEARSLAVILDHSNTKRRTIETAIYEEACVIFEKTADPSTADSVVVADSGWHTGVIGVVASRLTERYRRPSVVVAFDSDGVGRGSCRSIDGFHLLEALHACSDCLDRFGGHAMAAGLTVKNDRFDAFRDTFNRYCADTLQGRDLRPEMSIDAWLRPDELSYELVDSISLLSPMGHGNSAPLWGISALSVSGGPRLLGRDKSHLKLSFDIGGRSIDAIGFRLGGHTVPSGRVDVVFRLERNVFRGEESLQMHLVDMRPCEED